MDWGWEVALLWRPWGFWQKSSWKWARNVPGSKEGHMQQDWGEWLSPLTQHFLYHIELLCTVLGQHKEGIDNLERVHLRATGMLGLQSCCYMRRGLFSLETRWLWGDLAAACHYLCAGYQGEAGRLFTVLCDGMTKGSRYKGNKEVQMGKCNKEKCSSQGQLSRGTGCLQRLWSFCLQRFSSSNRTKPWASWSDHTAGPALSKRLNKRPTVRSIFTSLILWFFPWLKKKRFHLWYLYIQEIVSCKLFLITIK